jgi:transposase
VLGFVQGAYATEVLRGAILAVPSGQVEAAAAFGMSWLKRHSRSKPTTLLGFHRAPKERKYRRLFSPKRRGKPGPKGPSKARIQVIVEMKRRNPRYGCRRIAQRLSKAFGIEMDEGVVRRVLAKYYGPRPSGRSPSWLTFKGHAKDSLWSVDLFRWESIALKTHWVLVVMDQSTRRIIGFAARGAHLDIGFRTGAPHRLVQKRHVAHQ